MQVRRPPALTAAQQHGFLRANPLTAGGSGTLQGGRLVWRYAATPTPLSRVYSVRLDYHQGDIPKTFVDSPDLAALAEGREIPHLYEREPPRLCLYRPLRGEWWPWMRLDQTVVPWAALWLYYFELWLATGEWRGGGDHPGDPVDEDRACRDLLRRSEPPSTYITSPLPWRH